MMHILNNLTKQQKRFVLYGSLSLLFVGIIIFLISGLSTVSFTFFEESAEQRRDRQLTQAEKAYETVLETEYTRIKTYQLAVKNFGTSSVFGTVLQEREEYFQYLDTYMKNTLDMNIAINSSSISAITLPEEKSKACEEALALEEDIEDIYTPYINELYSLVEVQSPIFTLREKSNEYIKLFDACANE